jgi:DNA-binding NarL/FixJ family response regulator
MRTTPRPPWRVVLVEDHPDTLAYFQASIGRRAELALVASFDALAPALQWFEHHQADILLTDLALPDGSGLSLLRTVAASQPRCDMLVISMFGDEDHVIASIEAGAVGYVHKDAADADIAQVLVDVKQGASPISPMVARGVLARLKSLQGGVVAPDPEPEFEPTDSKVMLTSRETELLDMLARGYAYAEIAQHCSISLHTVQGHVKNIYGKLAVNSRAQAVFEGSRLGLIQSIRPKR